MLYKRKPKAPKSEMTNVITSDMYRLFLLLLAGRLIFAKSIQNKTEIEHVQARLDKMESIVGSLLETVNNMNSTFLRCEYLILIM